MSCDIPAYISISAERSGAIHEDGKAEKWRGKWRLVLVMEDDLARVSE